MSVTADEPVAAINRRRLGMQSGLVVLPFAFQQMLRFFSNVVLSYLLAPEIFGVMLLVNTLRIGVELLSDIGIGQTIVRSPRGNEQEFINTAWTLQVARGALLTLLALFAAIPAAWIYGNPQLDEILAIVSISFFISGLQSPAIFLMQRNVDLQGRARFDMLSTLLHVAAMITLAWVWPTVWSLVWGLVAASAISTLLSYTHRGYSLPRLAWNRTDASEILHFGKWVFLATAIYFFSISVDKLVLASAIPMALVGIYSISRTFADMAMQLSQRVGAYLIFPKVAGFGGSRAEMAKLLQPVYRAVIALLGLVLAGAIALSDSLVLLLYDERYHAAAFMVPVLLISIWFSILATFSESILLGVGKPQPMAKGNLVKFLVLLMGLTIAVTRGSLFDAMLVIIAAEVLRWLMLTVEMHREKLADFGFDLGVTVAMLVAAATIKTGAAMTGLVPSITAWWQLGASVHG